MTIWLRKRLAIWMGLSLSVGALLWNSDALRAQSYFRDFKDYKSKRKLSRDEAAKDFVKYLELRRDPDLYRQYVEPDIAIARETNIGAEMLAINSISPKSGRELDFDFQRILDALAEQWQEPKTTVKAQSESDTTATVIVESDATPAARPLVLIQENGGWGVDLVETYAKWNNVTGTRKLEAIYKLTGIKLPGLMTTEDHHKAGCQTNLKQLMEGISQYVQDYDERYPLAKSWASGLEPYVRGEALFSCPSLPKGKRYGYAYNSKVSSKWLLTLTKTGGIVSFYETSVLKHNAYGMGENLAFRHLNGANYAYDDGHVKWLPKSKTPKFNFLTLAEATE